MLVKILNQELTNQITQLFESQLVEPVELLYFFNNDDCDTCEETGQMLEEIEMLSGKLHITKYDVNENPTIAQKFGIQRTPGLVIAGGGPGEVIDYGIRFTGIPSGYEFGSLIHTIIMVSKRDSGLDPDIRKLLEDIKKPVHLQVFVTPT